jgi:hypothetical protein
MATRKKARKARTWREWRHEDDKSVCDFIGLDRCKHTFQVRVIEILPRRRGRR